MQEEGAQAAGRAALVTPANVVAVAFIVAVVVGSFAALLASMAPAASAGGLRALVHDADGATYELPLGEDARLEVSTSEGTNLVVVEDGQVSVAWADCDGQDCVHQGTLSQPGRQIICLPHRLWIEVVGNGEGPGQMDVEAAASVDADAPAGAVEGLDTLSR